MLSICNNLQILFWSTRYFAHWTCDCWL